MEGTAQLGPMECFLQNATETLFHYSIKGRFDPGQVTLRISSRTSAAAESVVHLALFSFVVPEPCMRTYSLRFFLRSPSRLSCKKLTSSRFQNTTASSLAPPSQSGRNTMLLPLTR